MSLSAAATVAMSLMIIACTSSSSAPWPSRPLVRLAELEIDPAQLDSYKAFLREEIETSIRVEPGVLSRSPYKASQPRSGSSSCTPTGPPTKRTSKRRTS